MIEKLKPEEWDKNKQPQILLGEIMGDMAVKINEIIQHINWLEQQLNYTGKE